MGADRNLCRCCRTWIFPFAHTVLRYEKLLHPKEATKARNRCGEANQGDVAAMTDAEIKKAKFFIVDVSDSIHSSLAPHAHTDVGWTESVESLWRRS